MYFGSQFQEDKIRQGGEDMAAGKGGMLAGAGAGSTLLKQRVDRRQASYKASRLALPDVSTSSRNSATSWGLRLRMCNSIGKHFKFNPLQGVTSKIYDVKLY